MKLYVAHLQSGAEDILEASSVQDAIRQMLEDHPRDDLRSVNPLEDEVLLVAETLEPEEEAA